MIQYPMTDLHVMRKRFEKGVLLLKLMGIFDSMMQSSMLH